MSCVRRFTQAVTVKIFSNTQWQRINKYKCPINVTTNAWINNAITNA